MAERVRDFGADGTTSISSATAATATATATGAPTGPARSATGLAGAAGSFVCRPETEKAAGAAWRGRGADRQILRQTEVHYPAGAEILPGNLEDRRHNDPVDRGVFFVVGLVVRRRFRPFNICA